MTNSERDQDLELGRSIIHQEIDALEALAVGLDEAFVRVAGLLSGCSGIVWVTAVGTSAAVGTRFAHILTCCGARSMFISPAEGLHGHAGILQPVDLLVAMSRGGESTEVNQMVAIANQRNVATVAFVHNTDSTLAPASRLVLPVPSPQEYELMGYLATASTVAYSAICDALCAVVAKAKGFDPEEFAKIHPGGAVGQVLGNPR
jgi:arabinose-5-phosphate isomerase